MIPYFSLNVVQAGPIGIQVWGFFASLGVLFALLISLRRAREREVKREAIYDIFLIALLSMIVGAKVFYILFLVGRGISINEIFAGGGFSFLGGVIFSAVAVLLYLKYKKMDVLKMADILTPALVIALIFIRIGCFLVYDHVGSVTRLPWGIAYIDGSIRHPVSLYLLLGNIVIFCIIWYLEKRKKYLASGALFFFFAISYSILRFTLDFTRCSDLTVCDARYFGLTYTQILLLAGAPVIISYLKNILINNKKNE